MKFGTLSLAPFLVIAACQSETPVTVTPKAPTIDAALVAPAAPTGGFTRITSGRAGGELSVILIGADGLPYLLVQDLSSGRWVFLGQLPNPNGLHFTEVATGYGNNGNLQIALVSTSGDPYLIYQSNSDGTYHWVGLLPDAAVPLGTVKSGAGNGLQLIYTTPQFTNGSWIDYQVGSSWFAYGGFPNYNGQKDFSTFETVVCTGSCGVGPRLTVFGLTSANTPTYPVGTLCANWQFIGAGETWQSDFGCIPRPDGKTFNVIGAGLGNNNNPQLVGLGTDDGLPYLWWQSTSSGYWSWYGALPDPSRIRFNVFTMGKGNHGNLQVIALGSSNGLPYLFWNSNSDGSWHWTGALPDTPGIPFKAVKAEQGNNTNLQVVGLGANDGLPYLIYQTNSDGKWHWYGALPH